MCGRTESSLNVQLLSRNGSSSIHIDITDVYISSADPLRKANTKIVFDYTVYEDPHRTDSSNPEHNVALKPCLSRASLSDLPH